MFKTFPSVNKSADFSFAVGSNSYSSSDSYIFDRIKTANPKFLMILGNIYSKNINSENWRDYESEYLKGIILLLT